MESDSNRPRVPHAIRRQIVLDWPSAPLSLLGRSFVRGLDRRMRRCGLEQLPVWTCANRRYNPHSRRGPVRSTGRSPPAKVTVFVRSLAGSSIAISICCSGQGEAPRRRNIPPNQIRHRSWQSGPILPGLPFLGISLRLRAGIKAPEHSACARVWQRAQDGRFVPVVAIRSFAAAGLTADAKLSSTELV